MVNYQNGKIYEIVNLGGDMCYIGSTTKDYLSKRMVAHRASYKHFQKTGAKNVTVFQLFDKYGIDNCRIVLVELCPCDTKDELLKREAYHINEMECVNKCRPCITKQEKADYRKQYMSDHREEIKNSSAKFYKDNKSSILKSRAEPTLCVCGSTITIGHISHHIKTAKHKNYMANQQIDV